MPTEGPNAMGQFATTIQGRYRVEREIGSGGMATVYRAHDLRHDRPVAIKVIHSELAAAIGAERFLAEIRTTARLQHPHILPLLDSGHATPGSEDGGPLYYVMPFVSGESLRDRLARETQLPVDDAVRIAREVADALGHAHSMGIVHRDIKPENILLQGGHALVADFGIALAVSAAGGTRLTQTGLSLGTPQYMSPEQAMGDRSIDARSDLYALGAVTYEMLTGEPPFSGPTVQSIVAKVLNERPVSPRTVRDTIPPHVERAVLTALARLPADRHATAQEFSRALVTAGTAPALAADGPESVSRPRAMSWTSLNTLTTAIAVAAVSWALVMRASGRPSESDAPIRFAITPPTGYQLADAMPGISDDGNTIVFAADSAGTTRLVVRRLDAVKSAPLPGTERAQGGATFTPDGGWVVYRQGDRLMRVRIDGSQTPQPVPGAPVVSTIFGPPSVTWQDDGSMILIAELAEGIFRIDPSGQRLDTLRLVQRGSAEQGLMYPVVIPGANALLFGVLRRTGWDLHARSLDGSREVTVVPGASRSQFLPPDRLVYSRGGVLYSSTFDVRALRVTGEATIFATGLPNFQFANSHAVYFALSRAGVLVHLGGSQQPRPRIHLIDVPEGRVTLFRDSIGNRPRFSPDGRSLVAEDSGQVWIYDLTRGGTRSLFSRTGLSYLPVWSPDGSRIISSTYDGGPAQLWSFSVNNPGDVRRLPASPRRRYAASFSADGKIMAFGEMAPATRRDILLLEADSVVRNWLSDSHNEFQPRISPDGRWLAYTSDESGAAEVYVRPLTGNGRAQRVSSAGGSSPVWEPRRSELFFRNGDWIYSSQISGAGFPSEPRTVIRVPGLALGDEITFVFDISPNGRQLVVQRDPPRPVDRELHVILNARSLMPTR